VLTVARRGCGDVTSADRVQPGRQGVRRIGSELVGILDDIVKIALVSQDITNGVLLGRSRVLTHEGGGVAQSLMRLLLLLQKPGKDVDVARPGLGAQVEQQGRDLRAMALSIPVNAAITLLDPDQ
jgi:hypothetical protein